MNKFVPLVILRENRSVPCICCGIHSVWWTITTIKNDLYFCNECVFEINKRFND